MDGLQNPAQEVMVITTSGVHEEGRAVQERRRRLRRSQTAHFMPGPSEGKPQNLDDPLRQALIAITEPQTAKRFFLKQLKAAEQESYCQDYGKIFRLKDRGLVDVTMGEESYSGSVNTALKIRHPSSVLLSQQGLTAFELGIRYYEKFEKCGVINDREKDIFVHGDELEKAFRTHLPELKHLYVVDYKAEKTPDTEPDHRHVTIDYIGAHFKLEKDPETINNLLSSFLAAFFRILADKSFEVQHQPMA